MVTEFKTISVGGQSLFKDRGSKFLGFSYAVNTEDDIKSCLENLRKEYHDARHHCYGYVLGADRSAVRANDDGEPNHSAGDPILGQIHSRELTYTLVVVIRYFGGTKLGVSGLINAYKSAADEALQASKIVIKTINSDIELRYSYDATSEVMRVVNDLSVEIIEQDFTQDCLLIGKIKIDAVMLLQKRIQLLKDTGVSVSLKI